MRRLRVTCCGSIPFGDSQETEKHKRKPGLCELGSEEVMELACYTGVRGHSGEADSTSHSIS